MSKLKKFFKHPVLFFRDSKLFGKSDVSSVKKCKNLFFIAHYGQLEQIQALIKYENLTDCFLCIIYTPANKNMPKLIVDNINHELIGGHYLAKLPVSPNRIHIENLIFMRRLYNSIINKADPENIFLLSFEVHYALISSIANKNNILVSLVEEGTSTYKFDDAGVNLAPVVSHERFKKQIFIIKHIPFLSKIRPALGTARDFDHIYAAFPQLLKNAFNYKTLTKFLLHAPGGKKLDANSLRVIEKYNINRNDLIFVSQRYAVEPELFFNSLFDFLSELAILTGSRVLVKLHPKEAAPSLVAAQNKLKELGPESNLELISENEFLIEPTIAHIKPKAVVGIASTSLAYTSLVSPKTASISFGEYLISSLMNSGSQKLKEIDVIKSHLDILSKFPNICLVNTSKMAFEAIDNHNKNMRTPNSINLDLISAAQKYSEEGKYWKAHCHYLWGFDGALPSRDLFSQYCCFLNNQFNLQSDIFEVSDFLLFLEFCSDNEIRVNQESLFLNVMHKSIKKAYTFYDFDSVKSIYLSAKKMHPDLSRSTGLMLPYLFALLLSRDFSSLKSELLEFYVSHLDENELPDFCYLLVEASLFDSNNTYLYKKLALEVKELSSFSNIWFDLIYSQIVLRSNSVASDKECKESYDFSEFSASFSIARMLASRLGDKYGAENFSNKSGLSYCLKPAYDREMAYLNFDLQKLGNFNEVFNNHDKWYEVPVCFQPLVLLVLGLNDFYIDFKNILSLNFDDFHPLEKAMVLNVVISSLYKRRSYDDIISLYESHSVLDGLLDASSCYKISFAFRSRGQLYNAWNLISQISTSFNTEASYLRHRAELSTLCASVGVANDCWRDLAALHPSLVPDLYWVLNQKQITLGEV